MTDMMVIFDGLQWVPVTGDAPAPPSNLAPTAPSSITATVTSTSTATVSWGAATDPDGTIAYYDVMVNGIIKVTTPLLTASLTELTAATFYTIAVRATDNEGTIGPSASTNITTTAFGDGWPDASTTGSRGSLTTLGYTTVNTPGTVIENRRVAGNIVVNAANVIIRNCEFLNDYAFFSIDASSAGCTNLLVEDCTFLGASSTAVLDGNGANTYRRLDIRNCPDGFKIGAGGTFEDSYIHDLTPYDPATDPHNDGIQFVGGVNITIRHNRILMGDHATSAILMSSGTDAGGNNCLVENNYLRGGTYTIYANQAGTTNMRFINNTFDPMWVGFGFVTNYAAGTGNVWTGNVELDGTPVSSG